MSSWSSEVAANIPRGAVDKRRLLEVIHGSSGKMPVEVETNLPPIAVVDSAGDVLGYLGSAEVNSILMHRQGENFLGWLIGNILAESISEAHQRIVEDAIDQKYAGLPDSPVFSPHDVATYAMAKLRECADIPKETETLKAILGVILWEADIKYYEHTVLALTGTDHYLKDRTGLKHPAFTNAWVSYGKSAGKFGSLHAEHYCRQLVDVQVAHFSGMNAKAIEDYWKHKEYLKDVRDGERVPMWMGYSPQYASPPKDESQLVEK